MVFWGAGGALFSRPRGILPEPLQATDPDSGSVSGEARLYQTRPPSPGDSSCPQAGWEGIDLAPGQMSSEVGGPFEDNFKQAQGTGCRGIGTHSGVLGLLLPAGRLTAGCGQPAVGDRGPAGGLRGLCVHATQRSRCQGNRA